MDSRFKEENNTGQTPTDPPQTSRRLGTRTTSDPYRASWRSSIVTYTPAVEKSPPTIPPFPPVKPVVVAYPGDYDRKFPEDRHSQEFGPNSRVYQVYLAEAATRDTEALDHWKDSLDVLLTFTGLFSAVVATFVVQTSSNLETNYGEVNADLQSETNTLLRAVLFNIPASDVPSSPNTKFSPESKDVWVNGLWYLSLTLALSAAMITMLIKQWLKYHTYSIPGTLQYRARVKEARYRAAHQWRLTVIIGILPILIHVAVFTFFAGLTLQLWSKSIVIAAIILAITGLTGLFYIITTILPLFFANCCYVTPLTLGLHASWRSTRIFWSAIFSYCLYMLKAWLRGSVMKPKFKHSKRAFSALRHSLRDAFKWQPMTHVERAAVQDSDTADVHILQWLHQNASLNPSIPPIICEAISGLREGFTQLSSLRDISSAVIEDWDSEIGGLMATSQTSRLERYLRMHAVLYESTTNFNIFRLHPHCIGAVILASITDETVLKKYRETQMKCCARTLDRADQLDNIHWIHSLIQMMTIGLKGSSLPNVPMPRLHPAAWINIFAYVTEFARVRSDSEELKKTVRCVRKHVDILLPAILNHHFKTHDDHPPYFAQPSKTKEDYGERYAVDAVSILELPPGHSRTRFLQFLYVFSTPTSEHQFNLYVEFSSFTANLVELWHKALLLHLNPYKIKRRPLDENVVGVIRELTGVLEKSALVSKQSDPDEARPAAGGRHKVLRKRRQTTTLERGISELMQDIRGKLKKALVNATFTTVLTPDSETPTQPPPTMSPSNSPNNNPVRPFSTAHRAGRTTTAIETRPPLTINTAICNSTDDSDVYIAPQRPQSLVAMAYSTFPSSATNPNSPRSPNSPTNPTSPISPVDSHSAQSPTADPFVGVQLISLIEALRRLTSTDSFKSVDFINRTIFQSLAPFVTLVSGLEIDPIRTPTDSYTEVLNKEGNVLMTGILQTVLGPKELLSSQLSPTESGTRPSLRDFDPKIKEAVSGLSRSLKFGSYVFILSDGVDIIFKALENVAETDLSHIKGPESILATFRAAQIISSFVQGILQTKSSFYGAEGRKYLGVSKTLDTCCKIMARAEYALYTLNATGVTDPHLYSLLSKLRPTIRPCLEMWWNDILSLTENHPGNFVDAWKYVFSRDTLHPLRPMPAVKPLTGQGHINTPPQSRPPSTAAFPDQMRYTPLDQVRFALYKRQHYRWAEQIRDALGVKSSDFNLGVSLTEDEYKHLSILSRLRIWFFSQKESGPEKDAWIVVNYDWIKDDLHENLTVREEVAPTDLGKALIPILDAMMQRRVQEHLDTEANRLVLSPSN